MTTTIIQGKSKIKNTGVISLSQFNNIHNETTSVPMEKNIVLNEKSPLRVMGYHTSVSDEKRWQILTKQCIPELGVNLVLFYLEGFVARFGNQKKDYSAAINIWNRDIEKIKKHYLNK